MEYTWTEAKRAINLATHQLDFARAPLVHEAPDHLTLAARRGPGGEERWQDLALCEGRVLSLIYTWRGGTVHCISLRPASRNERRLYAQERPYRTL